MMAETCSCPFTILITIIININIIIINIKIYHSPTSPTLFGVPCRDHVLDYLQNIKFQTLQTLGPKQ